jgi:hypothetical protein
MNLLNGYPLKLIEDQIFSRFSTFTATTIRLKIIKLNERLNQAREPVYISIGENCGPAVKLRGANLQALGASYFDNIVIPIDSFIELIKNDFNGVLSLSNLAVSSWEGHDSVINDRYKIYFHHYFHIRGSDNEKSRLEEGGVRARRIDEADIPLFLPEVMAQFEYLQFKFKLIMHSGLKKYCIVRRVNGELVDRNVSRLIYDTLVGYGANNFEIRIIHSQTPNDVDFDEGIHKFIPVQGERWGSTNAWHIALTPQ